jgi:hypothetical protein
VQVPVSGMYLVTTNMHGTTRYQVNSTAEIASNNRTVLGLYFVCTSDSTSSMTHYKKVGLEWMLSNFTTYADEHSKQTDYVASVTCCYVLTLYILWK